MRYLVLSDIHANLEALEAVLADAGEFDGALCLGDLVGYGPNPNECVGRILALPELVCLVGNHDLAAIGELDLDLFNPIARAAAVWTDRALDPAVRIFLQGLRPRLDLAEYVLAHGSPREPVWEYLESVHQGPANFAAFTGSVCLVGHTHVPRVFRQARGGSLRVKVGGIRHDDLVQVASEERWIINPGGVGQPRDGDPRAAYALWDSDRAEFRFRRVEYQVALTQRKILAAGLPQVLAARLSEGA